MSGRAADDETRADTTPWASRHDDTDETGAVGVSVTSDAAAFRTAYGYLRGPLKRRVDRFESLGDWLTQAGFDQTPDEYLAAAIRRSLLVASATGLLVAVSLALGPAPGGVEGSLLRAVSAGVALGSLGFAGSLAGHYYYPVLWAGWRRRHVDADLPHAIVLMYVLSESGLTLQEIVRRVADSEETYGEVAREFRAIRLDMDQFGVDPLTALDEAKRRSPSTDLAEFLDDLGNVIESGGRLDAFLETRSETQLEAARRRQKNLIETLATTVEGYITLVFAAPIFLITVLVVMAFIGVNTLLFVNLATYVLVPLGILGFLAFFQMFNRPYERRIWLRREDTATTGGTESSRRAERVRSLRRFLNQPVVSMQQRPALSLLVTVPGGLVVLLGVLLSGVVTPADYATDPIPTTSGLVVVPALIPSVGLVLAHESERRRRWAVRRRLPELLGGLADASRNGLLLHDAIGLVARRSEGPLATHLEHLDNDIRVTGNLQASLREFAAEVGVNRVTRVVKLLVEGHTASSTLASALDIAREDTEQRYRLDVEWRHAMQPYVAFFLIGVLVYLLIVLIFVEVFFPTLADVSDEAFAGATVFPIGEIGLPITAFEAALYHSLLIQAFGNGLVIGKLVENSLVGGLKYATPLLLVVVVVFHVV